MFFAGIRRRYQRGLLVSAVLFRLRKLGLDLQPYVMYLEKAPPSSRSSAFEVVRISAENLESVPRDGTFPVKTERWRARLANGDVGLFLMDRGEVVGYAWASLRHFGGAAVKRLFPLAEHQAYLFDMFVREDYRGRGLAICLRQAMARELEANGRTEFYSYTLCANTPARRFKRKLRAQPVELRFSGIFFSRWAVDVRLRSYGIGSAAPAFASASGPAREQY